MYSLILRPRSLLQLVIISFILVLAPLGLLLFHAIQALDGVSLKGRIATLDIVTLAKTSQNLPEFVLDMEHAARQYQVLGAIKLKRIYRLAGRRLSKSLDSICDKHLPDSFLQDCQRLNMLSRTLIEKLNSAAYDSESYKISLDDFNSLTEFTYTFVHSIQQLIEQRSLQLANDATKVKSHLLWQIVILVPLSIFLSIFFTYLITRPIQSLEKQIQKLGSGEIIPDFKMNGPKELQNLAAKLNWLQSQLQTLEVEKLSFIRQMSHELKTPLTSIREGADLLEEEGLGPLTKNQREIVQILQDKGLQLQRIIENLLDYNALKYQTKLIFAHFDFYKLLEDVLYDHRLDFQNSGIYYCLDGQTTLIFADRIKLRTLLSNLVSNAIYYSVPPARIWLSWAEENSNFIFKIANHGKHIPAEDRQRIFLPFEQGKQARTGSIKGSGIGLSVALECANLHQGTLKLIKHSVAEVCFELRIPQSINHSAIE